MDRALRDACALTAAVSGLRKTVEDWLEYKSCLPTGKGALPGGRCAGALIPVICSLGSSLRSRAYAGGSYRIPDPDEGRSRPSDA